MADDLAACTRIGAEVRARIESGTFPNELREKIAAHYEELHTAGRISEYSAPVAIRSSATSEDGADASFAGLQDTYLWVRGVESVIEHVRKCWASLYTVESIMYRRRLKLAEQGLSMGVVIQRMIDSRCSGVMFTRSPNTGDRSVVVVEASWGLGSAIVSGEVTPDKYVVGKITGEIVSRTVSTKLRQHRPNPDGAGVIDEEVPIEQQNVACLSDDDSPCAGRYCEACRTPLRLPARHRMGHRARPAAGRKHIPCCRAGPKLCGPSKDAVPVAAPKSKPFDHVFSLLGGGAAKK